MSGYSKTERELLVHMAGLRLTRKIGKLIADGTDLTHSLTMLHKMESIMDKEVRFS